MSVSQLNHFMYLSVDKFKSDSCKRTCSSSKNSNSSTLSIIGIITGIFGTVFGCMGMLGVRLSSSSGNQNRNQEITMSKIYQTHN